MDRFWVTAQFLEKCTKWPQMTFTYSRSKIPTCMLHTPRGPNFCPFRSQSAMSRFWVTAQFLEKCTEWPQITLTCARSKIPTCVLHTTLRPKFSSVLLYCEPFLSYGPIFGKVHRMTPNDLDMFKVKNTTMHVTYTPEAQIFFHFALRWAVFEFRPNFWKSASNDPKWSWHVQHQKYQRACYINPQGPNFRPCPFCSTMSRFWVMANFWKSAPNDPKWPWHVQGQKYQHACYTHPRGPNFRPFSSTMSHFWVIRPNFRKMHRMTPNNLDRFKVKNTNIHVTNTPGAQIFVCFTLRWAVFGLQPNFWKSAPNDPKWPWHVQGQKYHYACYIHPWGPSFHPFRSTMSCF